MCNSFGVRRLETIFYARLRLKIISLAIHFGHLLIPSMQILIDHHDAHVSYRLHDMYLKHMHIVHKGIR